MNGILAALLDVYDCRKALIEVDGHGTWAEAWELHRVRVLVEKILPLAKAKEMP